MSLTDFIRGARPANFQDKTDAVMVGSVRGQDVQFPNFLAGWVNIADGQYTAGSPLAITGGSKTQITIDGLGATTRTDYADGLHPNVWLNNRFTPRFLGETYTLRLTLVATQTTSGTGHYVTFEADIGTDETPFITATQSIPLIKGQGVSTVITIAAPFFCLETFALRGARLFLTPDVDISIHSAALFIQRTFTP
jgi:hypothetical protein